MFHNSYIYSWIILFIYIIFQIRLSQIMIRYSCLISENISSNSSTSRIDCQFPFIFKWMIKWNTWIKSSNNIFIFTTIINKMIDIIIYHSSNLSIITLFNPSSNVPHFILTMISIPNSISISNTSIYQIFLLQRNILNDYYNIMMFLWKILNRLKILKHDIMTQNTNILNLLSKIKFDFLSQIFIQNILQRNSIGNILIPTRLLNILNSRFIV